MNDRFDLNTLDDCFQNHQHLYDARGLRCPEPVMMLRMKMRHLPNDETLLVIADDPATTRDIPQFCRFMEHRLIVSRVDQTPFLFVLKKGLG